MGTKNPTHQPTQYPTKFPTPEPTKFPTPFPTAHPCDDGSHGCDKGPGGECHKGEGNAWTCGCAANYYCTYGCTMPHVDHGCALITSAPTISPTAIPTSQPTAFPTPEPT